jgi:hypothetical protein
MKKLLLLFSMFLMITFVACDEEDDFEDLIDEEITTEQPAQQQGQQQAQRPQGQQQGQMQMPPPSEPGKPITVFIPDPNDKNGNAYLIYAPQFVQVADDDQNPKRSTLVLYEDGKPLGPPHSLHKDIREQGKGKYSHYQSWIFMSTSDNSDPRSNGKKYTFEIK